MPDHYRKYIIANLFFMLIFLSSMTFGQIKKIEPTLGKPLDFGYETREKWAVRDSLLQGTRNWEDLTDTERKILTELGEVYEDMWDIVGSGCGWYCGGGVKGISASSTLSPQGSNSYNPENAHDHSYATAWVEGVDGAGIGEFLEYTFAGTSPRVTEIIIINGYVKSEKAWDSNSRVKKLKVYYMDQPLAILDLKDTSAPQHFKMNPLGYSDRDNLKALQDQDDWTLKFEILDVYPGSKYSDTVITEIYFDGIDVH